MPKSQILSSEEKGKILAYIDDGRTKRWIARRMGRSDKLIRNFLKNPEAYGKAKGRGRKSKLSTRHKRRVLKDVSNTTKGCRTVRNEVAPNVSHQTVWRAIKQSPNLVRQRLQKFPKLTQQHKDSRVAFAEQRVWWKRKWETVNFSVRKYPRL